jgi:hypothetical protein
MGVPRPGSVSDAELTALLEKNLPREVALREPTGKPSWPLVVLSGPESTGKTYNAVQLSSDQRLGPSFYMRCSPPKLTSRPARASRSTPKSSSPQTSGTPPPGGGGR